MPTNKKGRPAAKASGDKKRPGKAASPEAKKAAPREIKAKSPAKAPAKPVPSKVKSVSTAGPAPQAIFIPPLKVDAKGAPVSGSFRRPIPMFFIPPQSHTPVSNEKTELPVVYGDDEMVAMVRDPWWIFTYWEISGEKIKQGRQQLRQAPCRTVVRLHDTTEVEFDGKNSHYFKDHEVDFEAGNFYLNVWEPNRVYVAELGLLDEKGRFVMLLRSNAVRTPRAQPSPDWGTEWARFAGKFEEIYQLSGGGQTTAGKSSEQILGLEGKFPSSPGMTSPSSSWGGGGAGKKRGFFLWCATELILYGGTEPDAKLTVAGHPVKLRPDGTFSLRFALPDGEQVLRVHAVSVDNEEERSITPVVTKKPFDHA